jgi:membrane-bound lytic murein transglycosylase F
MASHKQLTLFVLALPIVTVACFQSPPSTDILRKSDGVSAELSSIPENTSDQVQIPVQQATRTPYAKYAKKHAAAFGLDWKLVVAVMEKESSFRHSAVSRKGAYGLMQIMPHTRAEIRRKLGMKEARTPYNNVKAGSYYLKRLSRNFQDADEDNRLRLTLAAYNAGLTRIRDAQRVAEYLGEDKNSWESVRAALPLLSKRFSSLHQQLWAEGKPRGGYFRDPSETVDYVAGVTSAYQDYMLSAPVGNSL